MNLSFFPTVEAIILTILVLGIGGFLSYRAIRLNPRPLTKKLEFLRFVILTIICLLIWQPEYVEIIKPKEKPKISILIDNSASMQTQDVELSAQNVITRKDYAASLLSKEQISALEATHLVDKGSFSSAPKEDAPKYAQACSDLARPLSDAMQSTDNLHAIVMVTDGGHNAQTPLLTQAQKLRARGVPLFLIPTGSEVPLPDLALQEVKAPTYGIVHETVQIPFTIKSTLDKDRQITVELKSKSSGRIATKTVNIPAQSETTDSLLWKIQQEGAEELELTVPVQTQERIKNNNSSSFLISGKKESIKVLVIDSLPRWEYRFIRNALYRDPGVEVHTLLFHPEITAMGEGPGYLLKFPEKPEQLASYDVIFIGDVGLGSKGLTNEQATMLKGMVENQASGIVFLPGHQGRLLELLNSDLADLLPVTFLSSKKTGTTHPTPTPLILTHEGRDSLLTLLGDSEDENDSIWRALPGFNWYAPVERAKAGTNVLAVHGNVKNNFGRLPLIVTQTYGTGKVLFMGTDAAWRWRKGVEDKYHYRFWSQVARWMSYQRNMAAGERIRLIPTPERPQLGDNLNVLAMVSDKLGAPMQKGDVFLDITSPDGKKTRRQMLSQNHTWGAYTASVKISQPGKWLLTASTVDEPEKSVTLPITTTSEQIEKIGHPLNQALLQELASITHGQIVRQEDIPQLIQKLQHLPQPPPIESRILLWCHPITLISVLALLSLFWIGRKLNGTI